MSAASSSVEVNVEAKKMEMADLFQYKVRTNPTSPASACDANTSRDACRSRAR
jgi:hypothetical protein